MQGPDGEILAFAFLNAEKFKLPDSVFSWDGLEALNSNSESMKGTELRAKLRRKEFADVDVSHLAAVGASATCKKGLGRRVINFQKLLSIAFDHKSKIIALEAIKPLDNELYPQMGFKNTTSSFYPLEDSSCLVPMFMKLQDVEVPLCLRKFKIANPIETTFRNMQRACIFDDDVGRHKMKTSYALTMAICTFLWRLKNDDDAKERLRQIVVRAEFSRKEAEKLWSMRHRCLSYSCTLEKTPLNVDDEWFKKKIDLNVAEDYVNI